MKMKIGTAPLSGTARAISSKSAAHRALICAALCRKASELIITDRSADIDATVECLTAMGAEICRQGEHYQVKPVVRGGGNVVLRCGESGSTLRFLVPVAAAVCRSAVAEGRGRLPARPLDHLTRVLMQHGVTTSAGSGQLNLPLAIEGQLQSGTYEIAGNISSQYISGLLFALPLLDGDSRIVLTSDMESTAYVSMTLAALAQYGIVIKPFAADAEAALKTAASADAAELPECAGAGFFVPGRQTYRAPEAAVNVEGDWSNAAFFLAAGAMAGTGVTCTGLDLSSAQGDKAVLSVLRAFGAETEVRPDGGVTVRKGVRPLSGIDIDVSQIPDLMPVLAITACAAQGKTVFRNAGRLRIKESDRIAATAALITGLGGRAEEGPDSLTVYGTGRLSGGEADSMGDHRIAMSAAAAAVICEKPVTINNAEAVEKSYPAFYEHYRALGGKADVI